MSESQKQAAVVRESIDPVLAESYPEVIRTRLAARDAKLAAALAGAGSISPEFVIAKFRRWAPGQSVRVAFLGGDDSLRRDLASVTRAWTTEANLRLDFGSPNGVTGFREWSTADADYAADIRVSFFAAGDHAGQWSQIGTDAVNRAVSLPGEPSLNLHGFDLDRPAYWHFIVIHEFGHALGLVHEHQHPTEGCEAAIRWEDDPGYVPTSDPDGRFIPDSAGRFPGVYTILGGPPNRWTRERVDSNLRNEPDSHAFDYSHFDRASVMKYPMPAGWLRAGTSSECFQVGINLELSRLDKVGIRSAYPQDAAAVQSLLDQKAAIVARLRSGRSGQVGESDAEQLIV